MANPMRGDVEVEALGRRYIFRLGINELLELQTALGYEDEEAFLNDVGKLRSIRALRTIGACALGRKPEDGGEVVMGLEDKEAGDVLSDLGVGAFVRAVAKAMTLAWGDPGAADSGKGRGRRASPGKRSLKTAPGPA